MLTSYSGNLQGSGLHCFFETPTRFSDLRRVVASWISQGKIDVSYILPTCVPVPHDDVNLKSMPAADTVMPPDPDSMPAADTMMLLLIL